MATTKRTPKKKAAAKKVAAKKTTVKTTAKKVGPPQLLNVEDPETLIGKSIRLHVGTDKECEAAIAEVDHFPASIKARFYDKETAKWEEKLRDIDSKDFHSITPVGW